MQEFITYIAQNYEQIIMAILAVVGAAATVAAMTPTPKDDAVISKILKVIKGVANVVGMNVGKAKNKED